MIINLLYDKNNIVKFTPTDNAPAAFAQNHFSVKSESDINSLKFTETASSVNITVISPDRSKLSEIIYDITGEYGILKIESSYDFINWYELPYKTDGKDVYIYSSSVSGYPEYLNLTTLELFIDYGSVLTYAFKKYNQYSASYDMLYENYEFQFMRFTFYDVTATPSQPLFFNQLDVLISEEINETLLNKRMLSNRMSAWHNSKAFDTYTFLPDLLDNFVAMLETNNAADISKEYEVYYLQKSYIDIVPINPGLFPLPPTAVTLFYPIGIGIIGVNYRVG